jgi:hypothetical protein
VLGVQRRGALEMGAGLGMARSRWLGRGGHAEQQHESKDEPTRWLRSVQRDHLRGVVAVGLGGKNELGSQPGSVELWRRAGGRLPRRSREESSPRAVLRGGGESANAGAAVGVGVTGAGGAAGSGVAIAAGAAGVGSTAALGAGELGEDRGRVTIATAIAATAITALAQINRDRECERVGLALTSAGAGTAWARVVWAPGGTIADIGIEPERPRVAAGPASRAPKDRARLRTFL